MICSECSGEMSKKWIPQSADKAAVISAVVWSCGVCGHQLTQADMKQSGKNRSKAVEAADALPAADYGSH